MTKSFLRDLKMVSKLMENFFKSQNFVGGLNQISSIGITGWEKWWQIEFAVFIDNLDGIDEWDMEHEFEVDQRKGGGDRVYVDFGFRVNDWKDEYVFLEFKQNQDYKKCIDNMFKDAEKYEMVKTRSTDGLKSRNNFVVGIFESFDMEYILQYFNDSMGEYGFDLTEEEYSFIKNKHCNWVMLIF